MQIECCLNVDFFLFLFENFVKILFFYYPKHHHRFVGQIFIIVTFTCCPKWLNVLANFVDIEREWFSLSLSLSEDCEMIIIIIKMNGTTTMTIITGNYQLLPPSRFGNHYHYHHHHHNNLMMN